MENNINDILAIKRAWRKGDKDRRVKDGSFTERKDLADAMRIGKALQKREDDAIFPAFALACCLLMALFLMMFCCKSCHAYTDQEAVKTIIGEAENQGYNGMLAVAGAIRNRGTLHGCYGLHAPRVIKHLYSKAIYLKALKAWHDSKEVDESNGGTGWGNDLDIDKFCTSLWWSHCIITAHIGEHWFYREVRQ